MGGTNSQMILSIYGIKVYSFSRLYNRCRMDCRHYNAYFVFLSAAARSFVGKWSYVFYLVARHRTVYTGSVFTTRGVRSHVSQRRFRSGFFPPVLSLEFMGFFFKGCSWMMHGHTVTDPSYLFFIITFREDPFPFSRRYFRFYSMDNICLGLPLLMFRYRWSHGQV